MSLFQHILNEFTQAGFTKEEKFAQPHLNQLLNRIATSNTGKPFDRDIAQQLWEHSHKISDRVELKDFIQTIIDARNVLEQNIAKCERHLRLEHTANKGELEECVLSYREDLDILNGTFRLQEAAKKSAVVHMEKSVGVGAPGEVENSSRIFADEASPREESLTLQYALYLVVLLLACELFCMFVRHHFINLMAYLSVLAIYFLNYFDAAYMKTVLAAVGIATVSDLAWLLLHSQHYWSLTEQTQYSHLRGGILGLVVIFAAATAIGKFLLLVLLFRFRANLPSARKMVSFCGNRVELNGQAGRNPVTCLLQSPEERN